LAIRQDRRAGRVGWWLHFQRLTRHQGHRRRWGPS
jgi:hypothetical protein